MKEIEVRKLKRSILGRTGRRFPIGTEVAVGRFGSDYILSTRDGKEVIRSLKTSKFHRYVERSG